MFAGLFPFHMIEDSDQFIAQTQSYHGTLDLFDKNNNLSTYYIDPDSHFYNTLSMQFRRKCNYFSVDEFNEQLCACNEPKTKNHPFPYVILMLEVLYKI